MFDSLNADTRFILVRLAVVLGAIVVITLVVAFGIGVFNKSIVVVEQDDPQQDTEDIQLVSSDTLWNSESGMSLPEIEELPEGPEAFWEITPCSLYVTESSSPVYDSLPEAPLPIDKPLEAQFLVTRWAEECGIEGENIQQVYVFTNLDTIYVDLPSEADPGGLKRTIEARFICFTRLFPMVAGNILSSYPEGIPLRGVEGVFR